MIRPSLRSCLIALTALAVGAGASAAQDKGNAAPNASTAKSAASKSTPDAKANMPADPKAAVASSRDVQALMDQFKAKRETILAERAQLESKLKAATEADKKKILNQIEAQQKELLEAQRALGKQIRDDMRKLRPSPPPPGRN